MKNLVLLLVLPLLMSAQADKAIVGEVGWLTNYKVALEQAQNDNKNVLIYFTGSDWCAPCKMLKKDLFETTEFQAISKDYALLYVDIPMNRDLISAEQLQHNKALSAKLNRKGSVPLLKIMDAKGHELDSYAGYSMNGEVRYHINLLEKHR